jgi:hypothetical protein
MTDHVSVVPRNPSGLVWGYRVYKRVELMNTPHFADRTAVPVQKRKHAGNSTYRDTHRVKQGVETE